MNTDLTALLRDAFSTVNTAEEEPEESGYTLKPGERRDTAVLFLDLAGFTELSGTLDHETVHELAKSIMNELVRTAQLYQGYVDKIEGDRIMVLFGAVSSGENDSRRAVLCGFKMLEVLKVAGTVLKDSGVNLGARIGISSGPVTVAPDAIGHLTAMGNTVNIASRMEQLADLNSILTTDRVHSLCNDCAVWKPPVELTVKGVESPVTGWIPVVPLRPGCALCDDAAFVGRKEEYAEMKEALYLAENGETGMNPGGSPRHLVFEITGEAGSGKARLASEFIADQCSGRLLLKGRSVSEGQPAHWLWSTVVTSLLGFQVQKAVSWEDFRAGVAEFCSAEKLESSLPFLGKLIPALSDDPRLVNLDSQAQTLETRLAVRDFIRELASTRQLVIFLEDTHWMDTTDSALLDFLIRNCSTPEPVIFLLTGRDSSSNAPVKKIRSDSHYSIYRTVELKELSRDECDEMASALSERFTAGGSHHFSDHALELLWQHSSGNPFFLRELVMHLIESGGIQLRDGVWRIVDSSVQLSRPETLTGLLQSRLDHLPDTWRKTLLLCAVLGTEFLLDTYRMVCSRLEVPCAGEDVFQGLIERQMLVKADSGDMMGYRFRHPLIQRTACESNLSHNMKLIHRAAAESIRELFMNDEDRISGKLATHWEGAGEITRAAEWGILAQKHASDNFQHSAVLHWGAKLLEWLPSELEDFLKVLELNAKAYQYTGRTEEHRNTLRKMMELAEGNDLPEWKARALMDTGSFNRASGDMESALKHLNEALDICVENGFQELESNTLGNIGVLSAGMGRIPDAKEYFSKARKIHSALGNRKGEASTLGNLGIMLRNMQDTEGATEHFQNALDIFQELGDIRSEAITLGNLGNIHHDTHSYQIALDLYSKALKIFTRIGDRNSQSIFLGNLGILHADMGNEAEAEDFYRRAITISVETGNLRSRGWTLSNMAMLRLKNSSVEEADAMYREALNLFREVKDSRMIAITLGATGYTSFLLGSIEKSLEDCSEAVAMASAMKLPSKDFENTLLKHLEEMEKLHPELDIPGLPGHWNIV